MEYEIVNLEEKKAVGISAVTNNKSPEMPKIIGGLWDEFYKKVYGEINDKANNKSIGMYHKYQPNGDYTVSICAEVNGTNQKYEVITIPSGKYAKFIVKGNVVTAVQEFWQKVWNMNLDRSFVCDFEEYQVGDDMDNMEIHMYISLK